MDPIVQYLIINREILALGPGVLAAAGLAHKLLEESRLQGKATAIGVAPLARSTVAPVLSALSLLR